MSTGNFFNQKQNVQTPTKYRFLIPFLILFAAGSVLSQDYPFRDESLSVEVRLDDLMGRLTLQEKVGFLWELAPEIERLDIDKYYHGNEALHGVVRPGKFTVFPQAIAFGATFNPDLIKEVSTAISDEARGRWNELDQGKNQKNFHSDLLTFWSPTVNMARDPRWGRTAETYGEDPFLTSEIGVAFVKGLQGDHPKYLKVVSTPKHYVANNVEENRMSANSIISERALREYYLPAFKACIVEGGAYSIMSAYNAVNYVPSNASRWLLKDVLRREWGFDGYVVSDCGGPCHLQVSHKFLPTREDAAAASIRSGMDLECNGGCNIIRDHLEKALELGKITEEEIDYALSNVLKARFKLGLFDSGESNPWTKIDPSVVGSVKHQELALETARQSIVLLKNENKILPVDQKKTRKIAVVGHNADQVIFGDYSGEPLNEPISPLKGIQNLVGTEVKLEVVNTQIRMHDLIMIDESFLTSLDGSKGLQASYFTNRDLEGVPDQRKDAMVDIHSSENPPDPFLKEGPKSIRWEGYLTPTVTGIHELGVSSDDGFRLWLNDEIILDEWKDQGETLYSISKKLEKGAAYKIKLEWYDGGGDFACRLLWKVPGASKQTYDSEVLAAKNSDLVIAVIGTGLYNEREGQDKSNLDLPGDQLDLLKAVYQANKNIVVVLVTGSQHTIPWIKENVPGILNAWYPGEQGGNAIAEVLFGKYNPAGRLPLTYYETLENLPALERYEVSEGRTYMYYEGDPLWEFGYGLSYSQFKYSHAKVTKSGSGTDSTWEISMTISNVGKYDGDEVAQLYLSYPESEVGRPQRQLRGFKRVFVPRKKSVQVTFELNREDFKYWSVMKQDWDVEKGKVIAYIGASSQDVRSFVELNVE